VKKNIGIVDRIVRIAFAVAVAVLALTHLLTGVAAIVLGIVALVLLVTAVVGVCPLYLLLGLSSKRRKA
jgi:hypothetical protein